ncbi:MAG: 5'-nucleotidase C-terminal domain-containing protein [Gemmatimonadota bacterium]|nr:5'-nucleotidase C-terminal domain-containing protein [Gemmatimonadota bacterium]
MVASSLLRVVCHRSRNVLAALTVFAAAVPVPGSLAAQRGNSSPARPAAGPAVVELRIAATTDIHGRVRGWDYFGDSTESGRGMARVATIVDSLRAAHPAGTILVDAGDFMQGNALTFVASRPGFAGTHPVIAAMNALKYDAVVLGNHEFNYGIATLDRTLAPAKFPVLAANARRTDGKKQWAPATHITRGGVRIAIVGVTTPWAMVWDRDLLKDKVVIDDIVTATRRSVADARRRGADVVVVVGHSGMGAATDDSLPGIPPENAMAAVARDVPGIDLIVVGHTHRELADTTINGVLLMQPRNWATSVAVAALRVERVGQSWRITSKRGSIVRAGGHVEKPAVLTLAESGHNAARRYVNEVIGTTATEWRTDSARTMDMPIIDFIGETMRRATGADLASTAVFSTNIRFAPGNISVARLAQLYPYDNTIRVLRFTGDRLKAYLEQSARYFRVTGSGATMRAAPDPAFIGFNFEVVTGAEYAIDLSRAPGDRITGLTVRGKPVTPTDSFTIALTNYRASGTGGYGMITGAPIVKDDGRDIRQLLIDEVSRLKELRAGDFYTQSWRVVPAALAAQAQAAIGGQPDFDAVRRPPL